MSYHQTSWKNKTSSPKIKESASGSLLKDLQYYFTEKNEKNENTEIIEIALHAANIQPNTIAQLRNADVWIFSCPLYVDGIPAHLLSCLIQLEKQQSQEKKVKRNEIHVYGIVNCGFYEGIQAEYALQILQNWCTKTGYIWSGGIGVGGGGGLAQMPSLKPGQGPKAPIEHVLKELAKNVLAGKMIQNKYVSVAFPRFLYKMGAQLGWRQMIRANGHRARDLGNRPSA